MQNSLTVVINCAGMGKRLQLAKTKALAIIADKPIIWWQLEALKWVKDIRIVVGYQASEVINAVKSIRPDALFVFNHQYETTGTAASFTLGALGAKGKIVSLDGDLIVCPKNLRSFIINEENALGVSDINTQEPSYATLDKQKKNVISFGKDSKITERIVEWTGLCALSSSQIEQSKKLGLDKGHVYQLVSPHLPMPKFDVEAREVDTPDDFDNAEQFILDRKHLWSNKK